MALESYMKNLIGPSSQVQIVNDNSISNSTNGRFGKHDVSTETEAADHSSRYSTRTAGLYDTTTPTIPEHEDCPCTPTVSRNRLCDLEASDRRDAVIVEEFVERHRSICDSLSPGVFPRSPYNRRVHKSPPPPHPLTPSESSEESPGGALNSNRVMKKRSRFGL